MSSAVSRSISPYNSSSRGSSPSQASQIAAQGEVHSCLRGGLSKKFTTMQPQGQVQSQSQHISRNHSPRPTNGANDTGAVDNDTSPPPVSEIADPTINSGTATTTSKSGRGGGSVDTSSPQVMTSIERGVDAPDTSGPGYKIIVEHLTKNVLEPHLREIFSVYGTIIDIELPLNRQFQINRGVAFITYAARSAAETAVAHMHDAQLDGVLLSVALAQPSRRFSPPLSRIARRSGLLDTRAPLVSQAAYFRGRGPPPSAGSRLRSPPRFRAPPPSQSRGHRFTRPLGDSWRGSRDRSSPGACSGSPRRSASCSTYSYSRSVSASPSRSPPAYRRSVRRRGSPYRRYSRSSYSSRGSSQRRRSYSRDRMRGRTRGHGAGPNHRSRYGHLMGRRSHSDHSYSRSRSLSRTPSRSRSRSRIRNMAGRGRTGGRSRTSSCSRTRSPTRSRTRSRSRVRTRSGSRSGSRSRSRSRSPSHNRARMRVHSRTRARTHSRSLSRSRTRARTRTRSRSASPPRFRARSRLRDRTWRSRRPR